jgi:hypothetical protein
MIDRRLGAGKEAALTADVPVTHAAAAERVRAHLVALRGGASFLSPTDSALLVRWLDEGIAVSHILRGLEIAAQKRREKRLRTPLSLSNAKRHMRAPRVAPTLAAEPGDHPLSPIAQAADSLALTRQDDSLHELSHALLSLPTQDRELMAQSAIALVSGYLEASWRDGPEADRERLRAQATDHLGDVAMFLDVARVEQLVEEHARCLHRAQFPGLDATRILQEALP